MYFANPDIRPRFFVIINDDLNSVMFDSRDFPGKTIEQVYAETHDGKNAIWVNELGSESAGYSVYLTLDTAYPLEYDGISTEVVDGIRKNFEFVGYIE